MSVPKSHQCCSQEFVAQTAVVEYDHDHKSADCGACVHNDDEFEELLGPPDWLEDFAEEKKAEDVDDQLMAAGENSERRREGRDEDSSLLHGELHGEVVSRKAAEWMTEALAGQRTEYRVPSTEYRVLSTEY